MKLFLKVVELGSFTDAAQSMDTTTASASRAISELEVRLSAKLLQRTTRRMVLTETGRRYRARCYAILDCLEQAELEISDADAHVRARPAGKLKVYSTSHLGQHYLVPLVTAYQHRYPHVELELTLGNGLPGFDAPYDALLLSVEDAFRARGWARERIGTVFGIACAAPTYLANQGLPHDPLEIRLHAFVELPTSKGITHLTFDGPDGSEVIEILSSSFSENSVNALAAALCEGRGIGVLPASVAMPHLSAGTLTRLFPQYTLDNQGVVGLYHAGQHLEPKLRTWLDFVAAELPPVQRA
jgi:DNA-binding transcriptional LysR family regulator